MSHLIDNIEVHHDPAKPVEEKREAGIIDSCNSDGDYEFTGPVMLGIDPGVVGSDSVIFASIPMKEVEEKDYEYAKGNYHKPVVINLEKSEPVTVTFDIETRGAEDFKRQTDHIDFTKIEKRILSHYNREIERAMEHEFFANYQRFYRDQGYSVGGFEEETPTYLRACDTPGYENYRVEKAVGWRKSKCGNHNIPIWDKVENVLAVDTEYGWAEVYVEGAHGHGTKRIEGTFRLVKIEEDAT